MEIHGRREVVRHRVLVPTWVAKTVMSLTGLVMAAFVVVHMLGNLKVLVDPEGMVRAAWRKVKVPGHPDAVRAALVELQAAPS